MVLSAQQQQQAAQLFALKWRGHHAPKKQATQAFWQDLLHNVYGEPHPERLITFDVRAWLNRADSTIDALIPKTHVLIGQHASGVDLSQPLQQSDGVLRTPFEQAMRYVESLPYSQRARIIVLSNFAEFWLYDLQQGHSNSLLSPVYIPTQASVDPQPEIIKLHELASHYQLLQLLTEPALTNTELVITQQKAAISVEAGKVVAKLYDLLLRAYPQDCERQVVLSSLNKLCVRLVFCWYADDAGLFTEPQYLYRYLQAQRTKAKTDYRETLAAVFRTLGTPQEQRLASADVAFADEKLMALPYVGGLFAGAEHDLLPAISPEIFAFILDQGENSCNWSEISPTIFGAVFESTLNPQTRRSGGMHYTSVENIHKVIDPLFLDDLQDEFAACLKLKTNSTRTQRLLALQQKLASLTFLDPACGSGNFLSESYICLRRLENRVIAELCHYQSYLDLEDLNPVKVSIGQFYGIEVNDFAVSVAKTALWIAESQMQAETNSIIKRTIDLFPLKSYDNIFEDNALTLLWSKVVSPQKLSFIIGNPPFSGARYMDEANKQDLKQVFGSDWHGKVADLDLVSGWFKKAHDVMCKAPHVKTAFVATNSICQGTAITNLWEPLLKGGSEITFAYRSFLWDNEASNKASVFCVIVGLGNKANHASTVRRIFENDVAQPAKHINAYLLSGPDAFVAAREHPLCDVPEGCMGNQPIDAGNYLFTPEQKAEFLRKEPNAVPYFHRWYGSKELLQGSERYCLYVGDCTESEIAAMPLVQERVEAVKQYRLQSQRQSTINLAERPQRFQTTNIPTAPFLVIPEVSSGEREYLPLDFMQPNSGLCSNKLKLFAHASLYHFSVLTSSVHMAWVKVAAGRLKMDINYSTELVYNTFPWPQKVDSKLQKKMENAAQKILDTRNKHQGRSLGQLYDREAMPADLRQAHHANDLLVLQAYGFDTSWSRDELFAALYKLYCKLLAAKK